MTMAEWNVKPIVFVVDDDGAARDSLRRLVESAGLEVRAYADAEDFLARYDPSRPGCLVLDICMPGMDGLELQQRLSAKRVRIPVIIVSAYGDVAKAVRAMKAGAVDFISKPYKNGILLERVRHAIGLDAEIRRASAERADAAFRIGRLTPREREIMDLMVAGKCAKDIGLTLGIDRKTVDFHRAHLIQKLGSDSLVDLVRMASLLAACPEGQSSSYAAPGKQSPPPEAHA